MRNMHGGDTFFLDHLQAGVITITNNNFTCRGKKDGSGGSMLDFFIISKIRICLIASILVDFDSPWGPHYGIELTLKSDVRLIENHVIMKADMPKSLASFFAGDLEENSRQDLKKPS